MNRFFHYVDENAELRAEIERLTEEKDKYKGLYETMYRKWSDLQDKEFNCEALRKEKNEYFDKAVELQKQVDKAWFEVGKMCMEERKDTAKEILLWLLENTVGTCDFEALFKERYGVEVE